MCLRILHVVGTMNRGGAETLLMNLYRKMDREKIQFDFVVHSRQKGDFDDEIKSLGGKIYYVPHYNGINHFLYKKSWHKFFLMNPQCTIIHGHIRSTAAIYLKIAKKYNRITIAHSHGTSSRGNALDRFVKKIIQYPIRYTADYFFACSHPAGLWLFGKEVCQSKRFWILKNAIDSSRFVFREDIRNEKRRELAIEDKFVIGHVGNFDPVKNHVFLLDIFGKIYQKDANCALILVGGGDPNIQSSIINLAKQKGLSQNIKFLGKRTDVHELLNAFDLFLLPSLHEGLPLVTVEAQTNGLRCMLSDVIPKEVAITEHVEFISIKRPAGFWAERILSLKKNDQRQDMRNVIRNAGYDINSTAQWLTDFYLTLQNEKRKI